MNPTGYYEIYSSYEYSNFVWRWRFKANNHQIIASGEAYYNKADCVAAINLMKGSGNSPTHGG